MRRYYRQLIVSGTIVGATLVAAAWLPVRLGDLQKPVPPPPPLAVYGERPQFVLLAFDGSASIPMWQATRQFARELAAKGKPVYFTYFVSGVYFLNQALAAHYQPPAHSPGTSLIGFAASNDDIANRVREVNAAFRDGHEIASHANGHFDGSHWTNDEWIQEFATFNDLFFNLERNNPGLVLPEPLAVKPEDVIGFRAPQLGANKALDEVLAKANFRYDASGVSGHNPGWPKKNADGLWEFPLSTITLPSGRSTISMDYSIFVLQTGGHNILKRGTPEWSAAQHDVLSGYLDYFNTHYRGKRAPIFIGHHFSTWNDGLYWQAMKDFADQVCGQPDVYCITHQALANYLDRLNLNVSKQ